MLCALRCVYCSRLRVSAERCCSVDELLCCYLHFSGIRVVKEDDAEADGCATRLIICIDNEVMELPLLTALGIRS